MVEEEALKRAVTCRPRCPVVGCGGDPGLTEPQPFIGGRIVDGAG
jgi:hypothetical protein